MELAGTLRREGKALASLMDSDLRLLMVDEEGGGCIIMSTKWFMNRRKSFTARSMSVASAWKVVCWCR